MKTNNSEEVKKALENLSMALDLIQEEKGVEGPNGGSITDHLDAAEYWLYDVRLFISNLPTSGRQEQPSSYVGDRSR